MEVKMKDQSNQFPVKFKQKSIKTIYGGKKLRPDQSVRPMKSVCKTVSIKPIVGEVGEKIVRKQPTT